MIPKLSVIIPVYGVEKYIERCARSLFEQTLPDIEFIFVDDCSPDNSIKKLELTLEKYPMRKKWTRIMRMPANSGQAAVRRHGIIAAKGEYVIHCDSDDWVAPDMYEKMYHYAVSGDYDIVWCDYFRSDGIHHTVRKQDCSPDKESLMKAFLSSRRIASVCNRLYKRRLQTTPDFLYPMDNMTEDFVITSQITLKAQRIGYLPEALYYYYYNPDSICTTVNEEKILQNFQGQLRNTNIILRVLDQAGLSGKCATEIISKKGTDKDFLFRLLDQRKYRKLWKETFPEVNDKFLSNPYIHLGSKVRAFCVLYHMYPFYHLIKSLFRSNG